MPYGTQTQNLRFAKPMAWGSSVYFPPWQAQATAAKMAGARERYGEALGVSQSRYAQMMEMLTGREGEGPTAVEEMAGLYRPGGAGYKAQELRTKERLGKQLAISRQRGVMTGMWSGAGDVAAQRGYGRDYERAMLEVQEKLAGVLGLKAQVGLGAAQAISGYRAPTYSASYA